MGAIPWLTAFAQQRGLRYQPEADERWIRAWEPYATLRVPLRYEHALEATGATGSISIARAVVAVPHGEVGTWIAIVQDERLTKRAAVTSDFGTPFAEPLDLVTLARLGTGEPAFDHHFASFSASPADLAVAVTPSLRKLLLGWRVPLHAEVRAGGFVLAPVSLSADERGLGWMLDAVHLFGAKATKHAMLPRNIGS